MVEGPQVLPGELSSRLNDFLEGAARARFLELLHRPPPPVLVPNRLRAGSKEALTRLQEEGFRFEPIPGLPYAFTISERDLDELKQCPEYRKGALLLAEASQVLTIALLGAFPRERILELAAGEGQHAVLAANLMGPQGRLTAVEAFRLRFARLEERLNHCGAAGAHLKQSEPRDYGRNAPRRYHRVLLAQPGPGDQRLFEGQTEASAQCLTRIPEHSVALKALLISALEAVRPGAICLYAVASYLPEVCEQVVHYAVSRFNGEIAVEPLKWPEDLALKTRPGLTSWLENEFDSSMVNAARLMPQGPYRGLFVCRMRKVGS
ncbi:MAG: hypothetical protein ACFB21_00590 [Opitutales bacterium]